MADTKITALTALTAADPANDVIPIVDVSDTTMAASGTTKKISVNNILGASGTATLASATITGDLTVDTSTLKVDSTNDRVGVGTASPATRFHVALAAATFGEVARFYDSSGNGISLTANGSSGFNQFTSTGAQPLIFNVNSGERYRIASDGVATWSNVGGVAGTAMTLNSTGLGVGGSPVTSHLISAQGPIAFGGTAGGTRTSYISNSAVASIYYTDGGASYPFDNFGNLIIQPRTNAGRSVIIATSSAAGTPVERLIVDPSGNVGVGVTTAAQKLTVLTNIGISAVTAAAADDRLIFTENMASANFGSQIVWKTASSGNAYASIGITNGAAGNTGTLIFSTSSSIFGSNNVERMRIDSAGNLILQSSATPATLGTNGMLTVNATSNTNLRFSYRGSDGVTRVANITLA